MAFFFSAYLLGHLIFMLGSRLDSFHDYRRRRSRGNDPDHTYW
jgi:hypothetical protein